MAAAAGESSGARSPSDPAGEVYDWYVRGLDLLASGNPQAALQLLRRVSEVAPRSGNVQEAVARALFDAGRYEEAAAQFEALLDQRPDDDYARFGIGLTLWRRGQFDAALTQLSMAVAMRPERADYRAAQRQVRATVRAREDAARSGNTSVDEDGR